MKRSKTKPVVASMRVVELAFAIERLRTTDPERHAEVMREIGAIEQKSRRS